ncbi:hypothetical protein Halru_0031 [Halovivax ruber XH-70]|uniref:Uncharacterized protein n=1 Tax=Halovivax ruber (strain DSM 18193 / JCM 13892 / XH-70) TaxID=797302 RepID=L0I582_HALRX|nr:hypothetical protein [Halovivax ruber]AGB14685.1 hypothetical protein Halru_0031 [Halovivax ruber XH-70]
MIGRRTILETISVGVVVFCVGCLERILKDDDEETTVLVVSNLSDEDLWFNIAIKGSDGTSLLEDRFFLEEGKGYATEQFEDVARFVEYELSSDESGTTRIPTDLEAPRSWPRKLFADYSPDDGLVVHSP